MAARASKEVIGRAAATTKIAAAVAARTSPNFLIMARTDARSVLGMDEAMRRAEAFLDAGADLLFVEAPQSLEELRRVAETFKGAMLVANMVEDGRTPYLPVADLQAMGFALAIYPVSALQVAARSLQQAYAAMAEAGQLPAGVARHGFGEYNTIVGLDRLVPSAMAG